MDEARRKYYYNKLVSYEENDLALPASVIDKWVRLGNLNNRKYEKLPAISVRLEKYRIYKSSPSKYEI